MALAKDVIGINAFDRFLRHERIDIDRSVIDVFIKCLIVKVLTIIFVAIIKILVVEKVFILK